MEAYPSPPSSPRPLPSDEQLEHTNLLLRVPRTGYSDRTESQHHLSSSSTLDLISDRGNDGSQGDELNEFGERDGDDDGTDNDNVNDREEGENETNTPGHTLSASAPVSLDPRMDLESGAYVPGNIVHGVVSQDGTMLYQVQNPTHALRIRTLAPDAVRTVVSPVQRYGFLSTDPSDYSLEIPNWHPAGSDADGVTDDDETWVPIDRSRRTRTVGVNGGSELVDERRQQQQASEDLAPLQRRYPRSFNRVSTTIHHTHLASAVNSSIPEEAGSEQTSSINAAEVTRQEIELNASDASIDSIATGLITNIVEQVLRNLQSTSSTQPEIDSNLPSTTLTRSNATTRGTRVLSSQQRESALRQPNDNPAPSFSTSNRRETPIFNLSDLNTSLENAPFTPSLSRRTTLSRPAEDDHFHTTGIPSRQEYIGAMRGMSAFAPSASSSSWTPVDDDPWIMAVRTFEARFRRGFSSFGSADIVTAVAAAALRSAREDESSSGSSSSEHFSYTSTRRNMRRRISHDQNHLAERISVGVIDWTRRARVSVTRRLYRTRDSLLEQDSALVMNPFISPNSSRPSSTEGSTLSNRMLGNPRIVDDTTVWVPEVDESVVFEMPLCEWLLTRGLLDSNGDIVEDASTLNQRSRNGAQSSTQYADARASAHISYSLQGRRRFPEICGFDVPEGGANLLHMGLDANGCPASDSALTIRVEEAVFELDDDEVSSNPDALRRVGVMHVEADYGGFPVLR